MGIATPWQLEEVTNYSSPCYPEIWLLNIYHHTTCSITSSIMCPQIDKIIYTCPGLSWAVLGGHDLCLLPLLSSLCVVGQELIWWMDQLLNPSLGDIFFFSVLLSSYYLFLIFCPSCILWVTWFLDSKFFGATSLLALWTLLGREWRDKTKTTVKTGLLSYLVTVTIYHSMSFLKQKK